MSLFTSAFIDCERISRVNTRDEVVFIRIMVVKDWKPSENCVCFARSPPPSKRNKCSKARLSEWTTNGSIDTHARRHAHVCRFLFFIWCRIWVLVLSFECAASTEWLTRSCVTWLNNSLRLIRYSFCPFAWLFLLCVTPTRQNGAKRFLSIVKSRSSFLPFFVQIVRTRLIIIASIYCFM